MKILILSALMVIIAVSGCTNQPPDYNQTGNHTMIMLSDGTIVDPDECIKRGLDSVIVFHSEGCSACAMAVPILEELAGEMDIEFEFIKLSANRERVFELGLMPTHIPTVLVNCKAYVGVKTKEEYMMLIEG